MEHSTVTFNRAELQTIYDCLSEFTQLIDSDGTRANRINAITEYLRTNCHMSHSATHPKKTFTASLPIRPVIDYLYAAEPAKIGTIRCHPEIGHRYRLGHWNACGTLMLDPIDIVVTSIDGDTMTAISNAYTAPMEFYRAPNPDLSRNISIWRYRPNLTVDEIDSDDLDIDNPIEFIELPL